MGLPTGIKLIVRVSSGTAAYLHRHLRLQASSDAFEIQGAVEAPIDKYQADAAASRDQAGRYLSGEEHSYPISQPRARDISEHSFEYTEEELAIAGTSLAADPQTTGPIRRPSFRSLSR